MFLACLDGPLDDAMRALLLLERQALHAWAIRFAHPRGRDALTITAPLAPDLEAFCAQRRAPSTGDTAGGTRSR